MYIVQSKVNSGEGATQAPGESVSPPTIPQPKSEDTDCMTPIIEGNLLGEWEEYTLS